MADEVVIFGAEGVLSAAEDIPPEDINASRNDDESESEDLINPQPDLHVLHHSETFEEPQFNNLMDFERNLPCCAGKKVTPISSDSSIDSQEHWYAKYQHARNRPFSKPGLNGTSDSRIQIYTTDNRVYNSPQQSAIKVREFGSPDAADEPSICSLYITSCLVKDESMKPSPVKAQNFEKSIEKLIAGKVRIQETSCGLVVEFTREEDIDRVMKLRMAEIFGHAVIVWRFPVGLKKYRKVVMVRDIPWCVPLLEIKSALKYQGIRSGRVSRKCGAIRIEIKNACDLERLLKEGLSFFDCVNFPVALEVVQHGHEEQDIIQCYRCQRFWHTAAHCRHPIRCVRCGNPHDVSVCNRPRSEAHCCLCGGRHHAAHKKCPVRLQYINSVQVEFSLNKS